MKVSHDLSVYEQDPYEAENLQSMKAYVENIIYYAQSSNLTDKTFLELGIGHSKTIEHLSKYFSSLTVLDIETSLIEKYKKLYPSVKFINTFFEKFETSKKFDYIGMGFVLEHVENPQDIIKKYKKILNKNGMIFVSVPNASSLHRIIANKAGLLEDIKQMSQTDKKYGHVRFLDYAEWIELFNSCGIKVVYSHGLYLKPFTTLQIEELSLAPSIKKALSLAAHNLPSISNSCFFCLKIEND